MLAPLLRDQVVSEFVASSLADTLAEAWRTCESGAQMVRLCGAMAGSEGWPTRQEILLVLCDCAETAFCHLPKNEVRPQECVRVSRLWAEGKATIEEVETAIRSVTGSTGPIARSGISRTNAASEFAGPAEWAATAAYVIADATLFAADIDRFVASGDVESDFLYSHGFWCKANGAIFAAGANKGFAEIVRARLRPKGLETYHRVTPVSDREAFTLALTRAFHEIEAALRQIPAGDESQEQFAQAVVQFEMAIVRKFSPEALWVSEVMEALSTIAKQAAKNPKERSTETLRAIVEWIPTAVSTVTDVAARWEASGPVIKAYFGI